MRKKADLRQQKQLPKILTLSLPPSLKYYRNQFPTENDSLVSRYVSESSLPNHQPKILRKSSKPKSKHSITTPKHSQKQAKAKPNGRNNNKGHVRRKLERCLTNTLHYITFNPNNKALKHIPESRGGNEGSILFDHTSLSLSLCLCVSLSLSLSPKFSSLSLQGKVRL